MKDNWEQCLALVFKEEGGYANDPHDPGKRTNHGVTQETWEEYVGRPVTEEEMKNLTVQDVTPLYKKNYWNACRCDDLPEGVDYAVFDLSVNSGVRRAAKTIQAVLGVVADGKIGPVTIAACEAANARDVATRVCEARLAFLQGLPTWQYYSKNWSSRVARVEKISFQMVG